MMSRRNRITGEFLLLLLIIGLVFGRYAGLAPLTIVFGFIAWMTWCLERWFVRRNEAKTAQDRADLANMGLSTRPSPLWALVRVAVAIIVTFLVQWNVFVPTGLASSLQDWPWAPNASLLRRVDALVAEGNFETARQLLVEKMAKPIGAPERDELEEREVNLLFAWGDTLKKDGNSAGAILLWGEAETLARKYGVLAVFALREDQVVIQLTAVPWPTPTPVPTYTPWPTPVPPTPMPTLPPGHEKCDQGDLLERTFPFEGELAELYSCKNDVTLFGIYWSSGRPSVGEFLAPRHEGECAGFVPGYRRSFAICIKEGRMVTQ